ncbi:MAG: hypothetical protein WDM79_10880 [Terricaulis sp.]
MPSRGTPPTSEERAKFRYPELRVTYLPSGARAKGLAAYGQLTWPGEYAVTIAQPAFFRSFLIEQLTLLVDDYSAELSVRGERYGDSVFPSCSTPAPAISPMCRRRSWRASFPIRALRKWAMRWSMVCAWNASMARGLWRCSTPRATDYSLKRIEHYTRRAVERRAALDLVHELSALRGRIRALGR